VESKNRHEGNNPHFGGKYISDKRLNSHGKSCMEICEICGHPFKEDEGNPKSPAEILGDLFQKSTNAVDHKVLCQACKEERGMLRLMGLGE
jgi:rubredoxin